MSDALLSPITRVIEKLGICAPAPPQLPAMARVRDDLAKLQAVRSVLDASVRLWLHEVRAVAYDADDVLDEYEYELLCARAAGEAGVATTRIPETKHESEAGDSPTPNIDALFWGRMTCQVEKIRDRLEEISRERAVADAGIWSSGVLRLSIVDQVESGTAKYVNGSDSVRI